MLAEEEPIDNGRYRYIKEKKSFGTKEVLSVPLKGHVLQIYWLYHNVYKIPEFWNDR